MTLSKTELEYIIAGLRMIECSNCKNTDKWEAALIIKKFQLNMQAYDLNGRCIDQLVANKAVGIHVEPAVRLQ